MEILFTFIFSILVLFLASFFLRSAIWHLRHPFMWFNYILWFVHDPFRWLYRNTQTGRGRLMYLGINLGILHYAYFLLMHILTTPLRLVNTIYFNYALLWPIALYDNLSELFAPKRRRMNRTKGAEYRKRWILGFPRRFVEAIWKSAGVILSSILMTGVEIILPVYTMLHGTDFNKAGTDIGQGGHWLVGNGDHAGSGVYFGITRKTALNYCSSENAAILLCRVCLTPCRSAGTLRKDHREMVGRDGEGISQNVGRFYKTIEHWRVDRKWFEYCLLQPKKSGQKVTLWRARVSG